VLDAHLDRVAGDDAAVAQRGRVDADDQVGVERRSSGGGRRSCSPVGVSEDLRRGTLLLEGDERVARVHHAVAVRVEVATGTSEACYEVLATSRG